MNTYLLYAMLTCILMQWYSIEGLPSGNIQISAIGFPKNNPASNEVNSLNIKQSNKKDKKKETPTKQQTERPTEQRTEKPTEQPIEQHTQGLKTKRLSTKRTSSSPLIFRDCDECCNYAINISSGFPHEIACVYSCCTAVCHQC
ncbi:uncharacterized protein LOC130623847 [Hydractinia symbiolongicarpus]|uniref:uncharacterized protein LOC130623847 n=1 Tax=Hydractinia symbiolongicarpus TaxID=13093 RepID=UPI00254D1E02|nr:uncharacterized protein LOC130623847 [Hydractinia symbiolongicarpus]